MLAPDKFPLAKAGWLHLTWTLALAWVACALGVRLLAWPLWAAWAFMLWFFRDPARASQAGGQAVISPADGKIVALETVDCPALAAGRAQLVSIFMNVFDVHVNRAPVSGRVISVTHRPGGFVPADRDRARVDNERLELLLQAADGTMVLVTQVAGLIARRIECRLAPGEFVQRGDRYGMIRFGSRLDVYLPLDARIDVALGQRVRAGETALGELGLHKSQTA